MLIGYTRVSTHDQTVNLQQDALEKAGCAKIFTDTITGSTFERKGLDEALAYVREGDTLYGFLKKEPCIRQLEATSGSRWRSEPGRVVVQANSNGQRALAPSRPGSRSSD